MRRDPITHAPDLWGLARDFLHAWLPTVRKASPNTVDAYRISLESYLGFLTDHASVPRDRISFDHFDRDHVKSWITWMNTDKKYTPRTVALRLSAVKAFLSYAAAEDITLMALHQAATLVKAPSIPKSPIDYLTTDETRALLAAFTGATRKSRRDRMLLILLYDTAARVGEITRLTLDNVNLDPPGHVTLTGKRNKTRIVPLTDATIKHLRVYLDEFHPGHRHTDQPLFYSLHQGQPTPLSTDTVATVVKHTADTARAICPSIPASIHPHMLRKTKAMDLYQQGIPLPIIMRLLGHENITTTNAFYAFATIDMMRQAINTATPTPDTPHLSDDALRTIHTLR